ncbi:MAG: hypothetical protein V4596_04070 [Bdellovibrionota bacterium]
MASTKTTKTKRKFKRTDTPSRKEKKQEDPLSTKSDRKGVLGTIESFLRKFRNFAFLLMLAPIAVLYIFCIGVSITPGILIFKEMNEYAAAYPVLEQSFILGFSIAAGIISFWTTMIFIIPLVNLPFLPLVQPQKGTWFSLNVIPWYYHNALAQLARYTVLDFVTPTPLNLLFYRMMGMKIGKGVVINTSNISDPCLITLEDYVTIGGSATIFAHYGMKGYLIVDRVHIKKGTTIGLKASVMGDVIIGENVMVTPHTVIMPKSRIQNDTMVGFKSSSPSN